MNLNDFELILLKRDEEQKKLRASKGRAYAGKGDVFANFKRNAERVGVTKYQIWLVYFNKHIDSITSAIQENPSAPVDNSEGMTGRIDDAINYLKLLAGMLEEDRQFGMELPAEKKEKEEKRPKLKARFGGHGTLG